MNITKQKITFLSAITLLVLLLTPLVVQAGTGFYILDKSARTGMLVSLSSNPGVVEPSSDKNAKALAGVIGTAATDLTIQEGQVAVQTDGVVQTLVSTLDGDIMVGDHISPSTLIGIGTKSVQAGWTVGIAQSSLSKDTAGAVKTTVMQSDGNSREVYVATIPVLINVNYHNPNPVAATTTEDTAIPKSIQKIADSIAGKRASVIAVLLAGLILIAGCAVGGYIIQSTIRNGIQSLARQPLARSAIIAGMSRTLALAFTLIVSSVIGALVIIRLL